MRYKVIHLDDEKMVTLLVRNALLAHDFDVTDTSDPLQLMPMLLEERYDLLITDFMMPGRNGLELCREIRANNHIKDLSILMLTIKRLSTEERKELMELNVGLLAKPFSPLSLTNKINSMLA